MPRTHLLTALALLVAGAVGLSQLRSSGAAPPPAPPPAIRVEAEGSDVIVHVAGEVRRPGVLRLKPWMRVDDAVRRAGGPTRRADLGAVNLAAKVQDGRQVLVPARARNGAVAAGAGGGAAAGPGAAVAAGPVNLNTATLEQLDALDGIGPTTAQKILSARDARGGFGSVDELGEIPGIGAKRLASLREAVTL